MRILFLNDWDRLFILSSDWSLDCTIRLKFLRCTIIFMFFFFFFFFFCVHMLRKFHPTTWSLLVCIYKLHGQLFFPMRKIKEWFNTSLCLPMASSECHLIAYSTLLTALIAGAQAIDIFLEWNVTLDNTIKPVSVDQPVRTYSLTSCFFVLFLVFYVIAKNS